MPLPESGPLSISDIATEFDVTLSNVALNSTLGTYAEIGKGETTAISDFYGLSAETPGSLMRYGTTDGNSIANRLIMPTTEEPTTGLRMGHGSTFTINFWVKAGWTSALDSQGRYQFFFGWAGNAVHPSYYSNVYNECFRIFYDESNNRFYVGVLADDASNSPKYAQNFWFFHNSGAIQTAAGLGSTYWSNTNRGNVNTNDFTMITVTWNGNASSANCRL